MATDQNDLVQQLTHRLTQVRAPPAASSADRPPLGPRTLAPAPGGQLTRSVGRQQLQTEKDALEQAIEDQGDAIALKLRLALLAVERQTPHHPQTRPRTRSKSSASPASSLSTSASTSSSTSFPSSPSTHVSPVLAPPPDLAPDVIAALRENQTLRVRLANSERVNAAYQRELAELRRRCGISIDELEELDLVGSGAGPSGSSASVRRPRSIPRGSSSERVLPPTSSIRIPGAAASVSPPSARLSTTSFPFSATNNGGSSARFAPQSYASYSSSINTTATTPSSSYPNARPPAPTPATAAAFSPASFIAAPAARRNSLNNLVATHFAAPSSSPSTPVPSEQHSSTGSTGNGSSGNVAAGGGSGTGMIDLDDLLNLAPPPLPGSAAGLGLQSGGSGRARRRSTASSSSASGSGSNLVEGGGAAPAPPPDPLVAAITRSLAKLAAAGRGVHESEADEDVDEDDEDDERSSETSRDDEIEPRRGLAGDEDDDEGEDTPLSISPGSRSGSLSRRVSARLTG
ncbi:hypothetical protein Rhopal_000329-T1 [Rhodotorula paludigena]|uniref:Proteophosphoglycan ppg4 n=1 Tax=Rhodotorula paludigena TaxID=86838 RepID=A0AAV5G4W6_9BASI|nr:hypothetical protein Rhopal_000329-T1 [Rhodotorula paludigena]